MTRAAIGRIAKLGDLYNARTDQFTSYNGLKRNLREDDIFPTRLNSTEIDFIYEDSLKEKLKKLGIDTELGLSICAGLAVPDGSASCLNDVKRSSKTERMTFAYSVRTCRENLEGIRRLADVEMLKEREATHIVVGINWGAKCNVTCEYDKSENEDETAAKSKLKARIEKFQAIDKVEGGASLDFGESKAENEDNFSYNCKSDVSDLSKHMPATVEEAISAASKLPSVTVSTNDGKGVPISYELAPLNPLRESLRLDADYDVTCKKISAGLIEKCFQTMDHAILMGARLSDLVLDLNNGKEFVLMEDIYKANVLQNEFEVAETSFKDALLQKVVDVRAGNTEPSDISKVMDIYLKEENSPSNIENKLFQFDGVLQKLALIKMFRKQGISCSSKSRVLEEIARLQTPKAYIMCFDISLKDLNPEVWQQNCDLFFRYKRSFGEKDEKEVAFLAIDIQNTPTKEKQKMWIEYREDQSLVINDVYGMEGTDLDLCLVKMRNKMQIRRMPNDRAFLALRCPKASKGCLDREVFWLCSECKEHVYYGKSYFDSDILHFDYGDTYRC